MHTVGAHIRRTRQERGLSLSQTARRAHVAKGYLSELERGLRDHPSEPILRALSGVLDVDLVACARTCAYPDGGSHADTALVLQRRPDGSVIIVELDRRAFLATAGVAGAVAAVPLPDRITPEVLTALSDRYDWHVRAGRVMPANTVSRLMQADLVEVNRVAGNVPRSIRPAMLTLASRFAEHLGWMRQEADDTVGALYWTDRAADFAHAAGWRHLVSYTLSRKAAIVLHTQPRHATELAGLVRRDRRLPAGVIAFAAGKEAEAHARAGNPKGAYEALDLARTAADRIDPDEPLPAPQMVTTGALLDARQSRCDLVLGRSEAVITTLAPITTEWTTPRSVINYGPPLAIAYARVGHIDKASRVAGRIAQSRRQCGSTGSPQDVRELRSALRPWAGRSDVDDVIAALSA